jgi:aminoglycoside phosphotransferase
MDWAGILCRILHALPSQLRFCLYDFLASIGSYIRPEYKNRRAQRLPFNLFLKRGDAVTLANEVRAIELVNRYTSIFTPRILDNLHDSKEQERWLLMTRIDGDISGEAIESMSANERTRWTQQLGSWLDELRQIPNPFPNAICSAVGGPVDDPRVKSRGSGGPFRSEAEFNATLRRQFLGGIIDQVDKVQAIQHDVCFTHADLSHRNILTKDGKIVGIVDWEMAGWYPAYWEYTKAHFLVFRMFPAWSEI